MPVLAVTDGGTDKVRPASKRAVSARISSDAIKCFALLSGSVITATEVTSDPVPLVVGIVINCGLEINFLIPAK